jgi:hypothetical protein
MRLFLFILTVLPILSYGQVKESDTLKLKARLSVTGLFQEGNVQTTIFRTKTEFQYKPLKDLIYQNTSSYIYQAFGGVKADEDILSLNFLTYKPENRIYPFALTFISTNFRREIGVRYLMGGGLTADFLKKKKSTLKLSLSSEVERTRFSNTNFNQNQYDGKAQVNTLRGTVWLYGRHSLFNDKVILFHESYVQPSLLEKENFRWRGELGMEFPVFKHLSFQVDYWHTFESLVITGQEQADRFLTFGVVLRSYEEH